MGTLFLLCAVVGGTILLLQTAMTVMGLAGDGLDGGDLAGDGGGDFGGHDFSGDAGTDVHSAGNDHGAGVDHGSDHGTVWFFKVITFQTLVAALTFFGLTGKAAQAANISNLGAMVIAVGAGIAAMYGMYYLMLSLHRLSADGTVQISRSIGLPGTVYVPIPATNSGAGKIQMNLQNRTVELLAMTAKERLPSGAKVKVVAVLGPDTVEVERLIESEVSNHV